MDHTELRLRCLEAAAKMAGSNPNVEQQARAFYTFVTEGLLDAMALKETLGEGAEINGNIVTAPRGAKGQRK